MRAPAEELVLALRQCHAIMRVSPFSIGSLTSG
jgi:hypothetical protein